MGYSAKDICLYRCGATAKVGLILTVDPQSISVSAPSIVAVGTTLFSHEGRLLELVQMRDTDEQQCQCRFSVFTASRYDVREGDTQFLLFAPMAFRAVQRFRVRRGQLIARRRIAG